MQPTEQFNQGLLQYLSTSPTPFHAVANMQRELAAQGFSLLNEAESWSLQAGGKYMVTRNGSALIAFVMPSQEQALQQGLRLVGAHTDSPCLKVKPQPEMCRQGYFQLGVEVYGGVLLNPWFDRDLSLAGRVSYRTTTGQLKSCLLDLRKPVAVIPSLAIHLDREVNQNRSINPQRDIPPILWQQAKLNAQDWRAQLLTLVQQQDGDAERVLDYELSFYDTQAAALVGWNQEFIASARLDNLLSCYVGLQALLQAPAPGAILVCTDHEEVGSASCCGAEGPFLQDVLARMWPEQELRLRIIQGSLLISADNAHGIHPNYADKHDANHGPLLNQGPVIKINANQRYATNSETSAVLRRLAELEQVPVQAFVVRTDMACGSTIGPITATKLGVPTVDVGVPTFAMHSIRELAGSDDAWYLYRMLSRFMQECPRFI
ncbi:M18 family aminopeptidase [Balneatrix alpica]|uniref:M18 family aminopeptidase n=1 Tax=Balneatrix alpica TaxID=75684 RepID=A0ABV5Z9L5_9GAMM|nr:M18 family aminopeptidase [Balneatrix alpica]